MNELNDWRLQSCSPRYILLRKCFFILIVMFFSMMTSFTSFGQTKERITLKLENMALEQVLKRIELESGYRMLYNKDLVATVKGITIQVNDELLATVLDRCLDGTNLSYMIKENTIIIAKKGTENRIEVTATIIKGVVKDKKGEPLVGVSVVIAGTATGTATDVNGNFSLPVKDSTGTLLFTYIGFKMQRVVFHRGKEVLVVMDEDLSELDAVTVIAYGSRKNRELIGAVSSVKADDMKELPTAGFENLLQGRMAGVEVVNQSGAPGGGGTLVVVRGYNTFNSQFDEPLSNSAPLYVIDGVPMYSFTSPRTGTNTIAEIDPSIIESVEVLKDAASAAIYGSRAGNGVILITTKKGKQGHSTFSANFSYTGSIFPKAPKHYGGMMERNYNIAALRGYRTASLFTGEYPNSIADASNFMGGQYDYFWNKGNSIDRNTIKALRVLQDSLNPFYNNATDWYKEAFRTGKIYNVNLQASGGTELMRYMVAAGYYSESGIMLSSDFNRMNVNVGLNIQPHKRIKLDTRLYAAYTDRSRGKSPNGKRMNYKVEGLTVDPRTASSLTLNSGVVKDKLLEALNEQIDKNNSYRFMGNMGLSFEFIDGLNVRIDGGIDYNQNNRNFFRPSTMDVTNMNENYIEEGITRNIFMQGEALLNYRFSIQEKHNFELLLGMSVDKSQLFENDADALGTPSDYIHYIQGVTSIKYTNPEWGEPQPYETVHASSSLEEKINLSYFGRLAYNFKSRYLFELTLRRDGSSVFGEDQRWATFPSVAIGWTFSDESFLKSVDWLSFGKIRASWGVSGQKFSQRYLSQGLLSANGTTFHGDIAMFPDIRGGVINKKLSWEETNQYDLGFDLSFLDYRLRLVIDYYYRYTKGQLNQISLPGDIYYHQFQWQNGMAISNQGLELELEADILRHTAVKWKMKFNASRNWNRFEKSADGFDFMEQVIGKPLHQIKVFKTDGFYNSLDEVPVYYLANKEVQPLYSGITAGIYLPGSRRLVDLNGDGRITEDADVYFAESPLPLAHGGFINQLRWKNFDLNIFFNYSLGRHIVKVYDDVSMTANGSAKPLFVDVNDVKIWTEAGSKADYPKSQVYAYLMNQTSGRYDCDIESVSFLRLKQLTLGYNVGERVLNKLKISGARIFVTGENLFLLTNYSGLDPELVNPTQGVDNMGSYPLPRKFTVGLSVNF